MLVYILLCSITAAIVIVILIRIVKRRILVCRSGKRRGAEEIVHLVSMIYSCWLFFRMFWVVLGLQWNCFSVRGLSDLRTFRLELPS